MVCRRSAPATVGRNLLEPEERGDPDSGAPPDKDSGRSPATSMRSVSPAPYELSLPRSSQHLGHALSQACCPDCQLSAGNQLIPPFLFMPACVVDQHRNFFLILFAALRVFLGVLRVM